MPDAAAFNVAVVTTYGLVHTSTSSNTHDDWTDIWGGWTWTSPDDTFQVTPRAEGVSTAHNIGVWYDTSAGTWAAFNEDRATMLTGLDFDVKPY